MSEAQQMTLPGLTPQWTLGDRLRKAREVAGLSQGEMAEAIGIARNSVSRYESGAYEPSRPVMIAWAFRTGVALDWLHGEDSPEPVYSGMPRQPAGMSGQPEPGYAEVRSPLDEFRKRLPLTPPEAPTRGDAQGWVVRSRPVAAEPAGSRSPEAGPCLPTIEGKTPGAAPRLGAGALTPFAALLAVAS